MRSPVAFSRLSKNIANEHSYIFLNIASIIIILAAIRFMEPIVSPLLIAMFISAISAPLMFWFMRHKIPQGAAVFLVISLVLVSGIIIFHFVGSSLSSFISDIPSYQQKLKEISFDLIPRLQELGLVVNKDELQKVFDLSAVMAFIGKTFNGLLNTLTNAFLIFLLVIFILIEFASFGKKMRLIAKNPEHTMNTLKSFSANLNQYIVLKSFMSLLTAFPIMIILYLMDIQYFVLWGFLVFVLNFIPSIGSILAAIPVVLLALVQQGYISAIAVFVLFIVVNNIVGNVIEPRLMGRTLGLSTLVVFVSLVVWGALLGTVGMFLSVPLTMALKITLEHHEKYHWISVLLSNQEELDEVKVYSR
ncbi:MAG: AI-2E family transporter [Gammaproteobacteria bacterium]|nr:AI-2E family transporter [Gammaproteobacteria bacterium]